jgi:hypothetical protein
MLRLALLSEAAAQQRTPAPDLDGTVEAVTPGGTLYLPAVDPFITPPLVEHGVYEADEAALLSEWLRHGQTFVDVGAHVGYFTCLAARLVGPRGLVLAFEPQPRNYELLLANVWRNGLTNVVVFPWAVSDSSGFATLHLRPRTPAATRLFAMPERDEKVPVGRRPQNPLTGS